MALDQTVRLGPQQQGNGPCDRVIQLLESSVGDQLQGTGEIARLVSTQSGRRDSGQFVQMLDRSVGEQLQGTGEIAKLVGVVAAMQNEQDYVRSEYVADISRIQNELAQLQAAMAQARREVLNDKVNDTQQAASMRLMYKKIEVKDMEMQDTIQENIRLQDEIELCRLAYEQDVSALEGMLQHAMQESDRLTQALETKGQTPPVLTPRTMVQTFERSAPPELTPRTIKKAFDGKILPTLKRQSTDSSSPDSQSRSSSNEPESEIRCGNDEYDRYRFQPTVRQPIC